MYIKKTFLISVLIVLNAVLLISCTQNITYEYLMQHPKVLEKEYTRCQETEFSKCDIVKRAAEDFSALVREQRYDADQFRQEIMQTQLRLSALVQARQEARDDQVKLKNIETDYHDQYLKLQNYYAVLALSTPE